MITQRGRFQAHRASGLVALSAILYGFMGFLGTDILRDNLTISTMLFWRFFIAALMLLLINLSRYSYNEMLRNFDKREIFILLTLGAIGYAGSSGFYFLASQYTGTGIAMVIFFSYPIVIALSSWLSRQSSFNFPTLITLIVMLVGLLLLKNESSHHSSGLGIFFGVLAAVSYAIYVMSSKHFANENSDTSLQSMIVCFGAAMCFLIFSVANQEFTCPKTAHAWMSLFALSLFATALAIQLMLIGLKTISSIRASIISVLEPLVTILIGILLLHESITHLQLLGTILLLSSALMIQFYRSL